jgi:DnaA regulatory inactivator Hda
VTVGRCRVVDGQFTLDLGHRPALGRDDFLVAPCNAEAVAWLDRWPDWPAHASALYGPAGCGKSHLLAVFATAHDGAVLAAAALNAEAVLRMDLPPVTLVDGLEALGDEAALFHLWNRAKEAGTHLLLAGREAPARLKIGLPDLRSRLAAIPAIGIGAPDDALLAALLVKHFADRQLRVGEDVVTYILGRIERSFAAIGSVVEALDRASLSERRPVTVPLARTVLEAMDKDDRQGELSWN